MTVTESTETKIVEDLKDLKTETAKVDTKNADELILDKLMGNMEDPLDAVPTLRMILFGDIGSGKTTAACDGPDVLLYAIERGQSSLINHPDILAKVKKVLRYTSVTQAERLAEQLKKNAFPQFKTVVLDTFSELAEEGLDNRLVEQASNDWERDSLTAETEDYSANAQYMRRIAAAFKDVPQNVVFICHEREEKNTKTGLVTVRASLSAKVNKTINQYADVVAYCWNETVEDREGNEIEHFYARLRPKKTDRGRIVAKTRIKSLESVIENFSLSKALNAKEKQINDLKKAKKS